MSNTANSLTPRFQGTDFVTLIVGTNKTVFHVHESILLSASDVFKAAFTSEFRESSDGFMSLPDEDVDAVERMIQWLYTRKIELTSMSLSNKSSDEGFWQLAKLHTLADKFNLKQLKNDIVDKLYEAQQPQHIAGSFRPPQPDVIAYVYKNTSEGSSFRKLMVAWYAWHIMLDWYEEEDTASILTNLPEFSADLAIALARKSLHPEQKSLFKQDRSICYEDD